MLTKLFKSRLTLLVVFLLVAAAINVMTQDAKEAPKARSIPGVNVPDQFPKACVSCHKNYPDMKFDGRLSTILTSWNEAVDPKILTKAQAVAPEGIVLKGKHSFKVTAETSIPETCNKCHGKMKNAPVLSQLLHAIHLKGDDNHFISMFQGECTHCHKLDAKGVWTVPNGKEGE